MIDGSTVRRRVDQMNIGSVESGPITKNVMMNSSKQSAKASAGRPDQDRPDLRQRHLPEDQPRRGAEVGAASSSAGSSRSSAATAIRRKYGKT